MILACILPVADPPETSFNDTSPRNVRKIDGSVLGDEDENEEEEEGYSELRRRPPKTIYPAQADFFEGRRNSITLPRCCGGSHLTRVENLVGT